MDLETQGHSYVAALGCESEGGEPGMRKKACSVRRFQKTGS